MDAGETSGSVEGNRLFINKNVMRKAFFQDWPLIVHQTNTQFLHFKILERIRPDNLRLYFPMASIPEEQGEVWEEPINRCL